MAGISSLSLLEVFLWEEEHNSAAAGVGTVLVNRLCRQREKQKSTFLLVAFARSHSRVTAAGQLWMLGSFLAASAGALLPLTIPEPSEGKARQGVTALWQPLSIPLLQQTNQDPLWADPVWI